MFKTFVGPVEEDAAVAYLRPETAQAIFVNFKNVLATTRKKLPFGIAQIGKAFRNEITPGNFIFRDREFEQMEIEYFVKPAEDAEASYQHWIEERARLVRRASASSASGSRVYEQPPEELAHYAKAHGRHRCTQFPFGASRARGIANRDDFDLTQHQQHSGEDLTYFDDETNERYLPHVVEPAAGVDRATLAFLLDAYDEEPDKDGTRVVLRLHRRWRRSRSRSCRSRKKDTLTPLAREIAADAARGTGWSPTTRPRRSGAATGARTRSARRSASRSTSTRSKTKELRFATATPWQQERVPIAELVSILREKLAL